MPHGLTGIGVVWRGVLRGGGNLLVFQPQRQLIQSFRAGPKAMLAHSSQLMPELLDKQRPRLHFPGERGHQTLQGSRFIRKDLGVVEHTCNLSGAVSYWNSKALINLCGDTILRAITLPSGDATFVAACANRSLPTASPISPSRSQVCPSTATATRTGTHIKLLVERGRGLLRQSDPPQAQARGFLLPGRAASRNQSLHQGIQRQRC